VIVKTAVFLDVMPCSLVCINHSKSHHIPEGGSIQYKNVCSLFVHVISSQKSLFNSHFQTLLLHYELVADVYKFVIRSVFESVYACACVCIFVVDKFIWVKMSYNTNLFILKHTLFFYLPYFPAYSACIILHKRSEIVKKEHARYTLERFPTDNARVICTKKGIGKYGIMY
jgi:hypothetical protein